jgi:hypothetical protein
MPYARACRTLPVPLFVELNQEALDGPEAQYIPESAQAELKFLDEFYTTSRGGMVTCDAYGSPAGLSVRAWRPYNLTLGWHSKMWGTCSPGKGWSFAGSDASVELRGECNAEATKCLVVQTFRPGQEQYGAQIQSVSVKVPGALTDAQVQACCFPESTATRNCSAVEEVVAAYRVEESDYSIFAAASMGSFRGVSVMSLAVLVALLLQQ